MSHKVISTEKAPKAIGSYSQAIVSNGFVFTSGQIPINPASGKIETTDFKAQVRQDLENCINSPLKDTEYHGKGIK